MNLRIINDKEEIKNLLNKGVPFKDLAKLYGYARTNGFKTAVFKLGIIPDSNGKFYEPQKEFVCQFCGEKFDNPQKLGGHSTFCKKNPNIKANIDVLNSNRLYATAASSLNHEIMKCRFCGKQVKGPGCLKVHESACKKNPEGKPRVVSFPSRGKSHPAWNKGKTTKNDERILKGAEKRKETIRSTEYVAKHYRHTPETKKILREKMIKRIEENGDSGFQQRYSIRGCKYIDSLNEKMGWKLVHAKNGGEYQVNGYFLDGYDKDLNIAFEYDEPKHYDNVYENVLKKKDIERQREIIETLHCRFFRYNEKLNLLYEVTNK